MAKEKRKYWIILGLFIFFVYIFVAAEPIPLETVLLPRWLSSLESDYSTFLGDDTPLSEDYLVPFKLGNRFGYVDTKGQFTINQVMKGTVSLSDEGWSEFEAIPEPVSIRSPAGEELTLIEGGRGYPLFLDGKILLVGEQQNSLSLVNELGELLWTYDFAAPLTSIDAGAGLILTGSLDGTVELLDSSGKRVFFFEPGGSRLSVIAGCRISRDGSRIAIVSGYDDQRFLMLERFGDSYKVAYHEFLEDGFRHAVHIAFVDNDNRVAFERQGGLGIYEVETRRSLKVPLLGTIRALDEMGSHGLLFVITANSGDVSSYSDSPMRGREKTLAAIRLPGVIVMQAPFRSETAFLSRRGQELYVGGGMTLASFELEKR
ncbi:WD40 repeat domain-containing protein [Treponema primitia]|uniref:WD40 repeat domain-containing protein n=1 Tax=Treponema primitia TaxID=88058 RepID=UPI0005A1EC24|nr:WD40 repeat domain-containing protein [Treponema primitia]